MKLSAIVCMDKNNGIGINNELLAHLPNDLKHFKNKTNGKIVIQGRKTYDSIIKMNGKPLPNRHNIVLTNNPIPLITVERQEEGLVIPVDSLDSILQHLKVVKELADIGNVLNEELREQETEVVVIGGGTVYELFLPYVNTLYVTEIDHEFEADTFFPKINNREWKEVESVYNEADDKHSYSYTFKTYERINKGVDFIARAEEG